MECVAAEGGRMVASELEGAGVLAEMAARGGAFGPVEAVVTSQDQPAAQTTKITTPKKSAEHTPTKLRTTSRPMKFRRKLTEAEEDERKIRRIMANRESARQTIQRRQAMHLELTRKADEALEKNENLKKQRELMLDEYYSLKERNEFLKAQLAKVTKVAAGETDEPSSSEAKKHFSATESTCIFLHNQPSKIPCFWPSIIPSPDIFPFQCPSNLSSSQLPSLHNGQEYSMGNTGPLFLVPIPWMLPLLNQGGKCWCSEARAVEEQSNHMQTMSLDSDGVHRPPSAIVVPGLFSPVRPREPPRSCHEDDGLDLTLVSATTNQDQIMCSSREEKAEDVFVATEARRRRKELMRLKHVHCKQTRY